MNHCNIGKLGALFISEGLGGSKTLLSLSLSYNNIIDFGAEKLAGSFGKSFGLGKEVSITRFQGDAGIGNSKLRLSL